MEAKDKFFKDILVGDSVTITRTWTNKDIEDFAFLSGDRNPLHCDDEYAASTSFKKRIVHGMLLGSLCSQVVGMYLPGKRCLYLQQNLKFKKPVFIGDTTVVFGTVVSKNESIQTLSVEVIIKKNDSIVVIGESLVQVLV